MKLALNDHHITLPKSTTFPIDFGKQMVPISLLATAQQEFLTKLSHTRYGIGGETRLSPSELHTMDIDDDYTSHTVIGLISTICGTSAMIHILNTPRGEVLRSWIMEDFCYARPRCFVTRSNNFIVSAEIVTIDFVPKMT